MQKGVSVHVGRRGVNFRFSRTLDPAVAALLRPRRHIVDVPVTRAGAVYVDERHTLFGIRNAVYTAAGDAEDAHRATFETADQYVDRYGYDGDMVARATLDAVPPAGTIGIFSDGDHHFEAVALTTLGRRMFYDINGDVLTTNGTPYLTDPDGA